MKKRVLVTGASKGIGAAIATDLARDGYAVTAHYHSDQAGAQAALDAAGVDGQILQFDVSDRAQCAEVIARDIEENGPFYGVVANAGIREDGLFAGMEATDWDKVLRTNLDSFYNVVYPVLMPMIRSRKGGRIVTISSLAGIEGNAGQVNYSAAKAGLIGATKALAQEVAKRKITANVVAPGLIETAMTAAGDIPQQLLNEIPMARMGQPEEVAGVVNFLMSDKSSYVTREVIRVDGGV
ncbi:3-oxoacyl-ACP reductase FabG [Salinibius halmophilus]|uniref:3-oxoacyl-ACP reductase FabG n=1 Tax=Salinibius halmophilus TaxID=1853216 RepID=UPI000E664C23|nr:3-oxoacyl-ACP reductase FabG [Salinibius halmophilus]